MRLQTLSVVFFDFSNKYIQSLLSILGDPVAASWNDVGYYRTKVNIKSVRAPILRDPAAASWHGVIFLYPLAQIYDYHVVPTSCSLVLGLWGCKIIQCSIAMRSKSMKSICGKQVDDYQAACPCKLNNCK